MRLFVTARRQKTRLLAGFALATLVALAACTPLTTTTQVATVKSDNKTASSAKGPDKPIPAPTPTRAPTPSANSGPSTGSTSLTAFAESFSNLPLQVPWIDGGVYGSWTAAYNGYGTMTITRDGSNVLAESPKQSTRAGETHAGLALTTRRFGNVDISVRQRTVQQLRLPTPNPWEVPWLLWNYTDDDHFYSVVLKPNGWEIGKEDPAYPGAQRYLATGSSPQFAVGPWHTIRVRQFGNQITAWGDGVLLATVTDTERPYSTGNVGLYTEDALVHHSDVSVGVPLTP
jgi:hypothetical protein